MTVWPQYTMLALMAMSLGVCLARYGEPKRGTYGAADIWIAPALSIWLLYAGGFFTVLGWAP